MLMPKTQALDSQIGHYPGTIQGRDILLVTLTNARCFDHTTSGRPRRGNEIILPILQERLPSPALHPLRRKCTIPIPYGHHLVCAFVRGFDNLAILGRRLMLSFDYGGSFPLLSVCTPCITDPREC